MNGLLSKLFFHPLILALQPTKPMYEIALSGIVRPTGPAGRHRICVAEVKDEKPESLEGNDSDASSGFAGMRRDPLESP